jgi:indolepyruvate ferredoxin oxidoreductase
MILGCATTDCISQAILHAFGVDVSIASAPRLDDRYDASRDRILVTGMQAIVRLLIDQHARDIDAGLNTAGFVSGYRGSPLGRLDSELWAAAKHLAPRNIHFQPGVNEELAATSVWGSQQVGLLGPARFDGVFGLWYGKGPGVDRSGDAFKHANMAGTAKHGGVLAIAGDDHGAKSSTIAHQSEQAFAAAMMPVLVPADLQDVIDYGLLGYAMSRAAGCWVGMKVATQIADSTMSVRSGRGLQIHALPPDGSLSIRWPENKMTMEARLGDKLQVVRAFARANKIDSIVRDDPGARVGIVTVGKAHLDSTEALRLAGPDLPSLRVYKVGMPWPLEPEGILAFAQGLDRILVVEEKRDLVQSQLRDFLYDAAASGPVPIVAGKRTHRTPELLPEHGELSPQLVAHAIRQLIGTALPVAKTSSPDALPEVLTRKEYFCAGCPHGRSTRVPDGSIALAGIGCHTMASRMPDRNTATVCQMGGEGATWIGQAPFVERQHVFQNLGDGTYFHSGFLAIRAAIAAKVNITYKILLNDAVAMTGGQPIEGSLDARQICTELLAEGASKIVVVTDDPRRPRALPDGVTVRDRKEHDTVQRELREVAGTSVLIFEQVCAAEKRRRRKRGLMPDTPKRLFINERVCEGCGDCVKQSSCIAVTPVDTFLGPKRVIDQSACNKDFSCLEGFCPSFVELTGAELRKVDSVRVRAWLDATPSPTAPDPQRLNDTYSILITGIGGTGVVTIGAVVAMAAHLDGLACSVMDMTGLAQKNGAVTSHVILGPNGGPTKPARIGQGDADLMIACDAVVGAASEQLALLAPHASVIVNSDVAATSGMTFDLSASPDLDLLFRRLSAATSARSAPCEAGDVSRRLLGDSVYANMLILGFAWQKGRVPVSLANLLSAIRLNGAAVDNNLTAFELGRRLAAGGREALAEIDTAPAAKPRPSDESTPDLIKRHADFLRAYHDQAYADRYVAHVTPFLAKDEALARAVAMSLVRLMTIKDEYEVARLYTDGQFKATLENQFARAGRMRIYLAPPGLTRKDPVSGRPRKIAFGPWVLPVLGMLARLKGLRGTRFDVFGWTRERRMERRLLVDYEDLLDELLAGATPARMEVARKLASLPQRIRGYGHVKQAAVEAVAAEQEAFVKRWRALANTPGLALAPTEPAMAH